MKTRRGAIGRIFLGLLTGGWTLVSCVAPSSRRSPRTSDPKADSEATRLERDLARLGQRTYSDQGIPVLLVGEDLAAVGVGARRARTVTGSAESTRLAREFHRLVGLMKRLRSERTDEDVPKLIEVLADRDLETRDHRHAP